MKTRMLRDIKVSEVGMGCMAFSHGYGQIPPESYSIEAIRNAYEHGCTFFDTAEVYSPGLSGIGHNERIVGKALKDVRDQVVIATKLFLNVGLGGNVYKTVRSHLEASMERLQTDRVDLYYLHRMGSVPVEKVAEAMGRLIDDGLIRGRGLSQVDVDVIDLPTVVKPFLPVSVNGMEVPTDLMGFLPTVPEFPTIKVPRKKRPKERYGKRKHAKKATTTLLLNETEVRREQEEAQKRADERDKLRQKQRRLEAEQRRAQRSKALRGTARTVASA